MFLANAIPLENKRRLLHTYLLKFLFKKASMSKCLSDNKKFFGPENVFSSREKTFHSRTRW